MNDPRPAAFFDLDKTLIRGDSQTMELRHVLAHEHPPLRFYAALAGPVITGALAHLNLASHIAHNQSYVKTYRGIHEDALMERGHLLFSRVIRNAFIGEALDLLNSHRDRGHVIVLVSATACHILEPVRDFIKPHLSVCTRLEFNGTGLCTGHAWGGICMGDEKAARVRRMAVDHHLDLGASFAYSDHHADLPFLESVGHPVAVNPTPRLARIARQRHWPVRRFP